MPPTPALLAFLSASFLLAITPGPGLLYVLTRSLAGGRREGILSSLGTWVGGFAHVLAAAFGLSALLATSALAYQLVKYAGAAYLVYLGIQMMRGAGDEPAVDATGPVDQHAFRQGIVTEVLNPKTALFFLSFIPQFVSPSAGPTLPQFLLLGTISVCMNTMADVVVALFAGPIGNLLRSRRARRNQRLGTGAAMTSLGAYVAIES
ncbi:MAG: LysE family translocator [Bryobacteraceae bacterium]|nr:LysE family translocator [Bryobacteraceae bacterium]